MATEWNRIDAKLENLWKMSDRWKYKNALNARFLSHLKVKIDSFLAIQTKSDYQEND